jgi:hypothetical protein
MTRIRQARLRRVAKWSSLALLIAGVALWLMSIYCAGEVGWDGSRHSRMVFVGLVPGTAYLVVITDTERNLQVFRTHRGWSQGPIALFGDVRYTPRLRRAPCTGSSWGVRIPLRLSMIFAIPAAVLFYGDHRRARPGFCPCGYSLAGLADGVPCPECGKAPA